MTTQLYLPEKHRLQVNDILRKYLNDEHEVWVYGSRINGLAHDTSDLDLVIRNRYNLSKSFSKLYDLRTAFSESNIPIMVDVMDWAIIPQSFHQQIEKEYLLWNQ